MNADLPEGATPIDAEEADELIPALSTRGELNEFEAINIAQAMVWAENSRRISKDLLSAETLNLLHKRMFSRTWRWAGKYRLTQKNIGVEAYKIGEAIHGLLEDTKLWIQSKVYDPNEIAARFHHRLVSVHAYPNGNGRHARLATDLLCMNQGWPLPTWGSTALDGPSNIRKRYLEALRQADAGDIHPLRSFLYS